MRAPSLRNATKASWNTSKKFKEHDAEGNQTLLKTTTGIWTVVYNAKNRPVSFIKTEGENTSMVECGYDCMGRRCMKKITANGTVTLHQRYIYRGYLQIACADLTRSGHPCHPDYAALDDPEHPRHMEANRKYNRLVGLS